MILLARFGMFRVLLRLRCIVGCVGWETDRNWWCMGIPNRIAQPHCTCTCMRPHSRLTGSLPCFSTVAIFSLHFFCFLHILDACFSMESSLQLPNHTCLPFRGVENDDEAFRPLNPESGEIRCVILLPGSVDDPIACKLVYTTINEDSTTRVDYVALSYCWGDVEDTVEISLHGPTTNSSGAHQEHISAPFRITRHLHSALTALRNERRQCFWIDALCINQQDPHEKTHQVQFMGKIYSSAESVLVWLGPEDRYSRYLLRAWRAHLQPLVCSFDSKTLVDNIYEEFCKSTYTLWTDFGARRGTWRTCARPW